MSIIPLPYILVFLITVATTCFHRYDKNKGVLYLKLYVFFFSIFMFYGLRGFIWTDWASYYSHYQKFPNLFNISELTPYFSNKLVSWEKGFVYLMVFTKTIWNNYFFFQFISFTLDIILLYIFLKEWLPFQLIPFAICIYFVFIGSSMSINELRQGKAILLGAISLKYAYQRKILPFIILNTVGLLFHTSVILFFPLYFIVCRKHSRKLIIYIFLLGNVFFLFNISWLTTFLNFILSFLPFSKFTYLIKQYLTSSAFGQRYGLSLGFLERTFSFLVIYHFEPYLLRKDKRNLIFVNIFYIYIFTFLYFSEITIVLDRVANYFAYGYWILYPQIYSLIPKKKKYIFLILFVVYGMAKNYAFNNQSICIYENCIFTGDNFEERFQMMVDQFSKQ